MSHHKSPGTALVTGAARRIGQAIALSLADRGYNIALHCHRSKADALKTAVAIRGKGVRCEIFSCDLSSEKDTLLLVSGVYAKFPNLNLLVNSASLFVPSRLDRRGLKLFDQHMIVNLKTPYILTIEFARLCLSGQIINILDTNIVKQKTKYLAYLLSKKALAELTKMSAVALGPRIRVNGIAPGLILPPEQKGAAYLDRRAKMIPLGRRGDVRNITRSVGFLLDNDYLTGQILFNDGGEHLI